VAVRPLRVEELAEVLAVDFDSEGIQKLNPSWRWEDQEEAVMSACSSLVVVVKDSDSRIVQFSHFSVKEYLTSDRLAESSRDVSYYHIPLESAHTVLAQACLGVLLQLDDQNDRDTIKNFPLAQYAAEHWAKHAQFGNVASRIKAGMKCLFDADKPHFATWLWIYNPDFHPLMPSMRPQRPEAVPLYYAARFGFRDLTEHLLTKHPEDVHARGGEEVTPLHATAMFGHTEVFSSLVEHFPDLDIQGRWHQTPLHHASYGGHVEIGQRLLDRGADINVQDEDGWTSLYITANHGSLDFARMLLERGAAINIPDDGGQTPLHRASENGHLEFVRLLLEYGVDPDARDVNGLTPSDVASRRGQQEIGQVLSQYGAKSSVGE
jgi:Ankyrin repeats (many copies)/Ankyrin repeats (3 copies)